MPSKFTRTLLFLSSYTPLFLILGVISWGKNYLLTFVFIISGICIYFLLKTFLTHTQRTVNSERIKIISCEHHGSEVLSYIVTYFLPFMVDFSKPPNELLALLLLFVTIGFLYVNSNMIHINPVLSAWGYQLYEVELVGGRKFSLLYKGRLVVGTQLDAVPIGDAIYLQKES